MPGAGETRLAGGNLRAASMVLNGGLLTGAGVVSLGPGADLENLAGELRPGGSPGTLTVLGNYRQGPGGVLAVELGGTAQGIDYDLLAVAGEVNLDGTLAIDLVGGFSPPVGSDFQIVSSTGGAITGDFATVVAPAGFDFAGTPNVPAPGLYGVADTTTPGGTTC